MKGGAGQHPKKKVASEEVPGRPGCGGGGPLGQKGPHVQWSPVSCHEPTPAVPNCQEDAWADVPQGMKEVGRIPRLAALCPGLSENRLACGHLWGRSETTPNYSRGKWPLD